ncbi:MULTISPECIES: glucose-1-phosphate thymidylyltransferase [Oceanotoga]|jgi:glucose-1-phosphate thymidylyltransferase|uniref:Glucose-1-phosphate thymidylyltransferase n=1 Tax=Oceanotoga teriensis TaxID=515440 RepID=A0AA45C8T9_9BACT|nr:MULTISPECIES: glucose-1-phosphate thymidylyltransferase [Oceanotoga]MDN5342076.1 glucose-phosphate thymidylyltransferase [Oceanotoga sp.]MDO7975454.1 glucose-1-phosphate thymidylyltransferase [Oceanotoga teriensis]PWJ96258.1 glucose-1-phosphate thymidylyltransferase [Oceanotoga teriensis]
MKALVLCAGKGTRLRPLTFTNAKPLIPIANKPTIMYSLEKIKQSGITEVGIIVNPDNKEDFINVLGTGEEIGMEISYIIQENPKGLAHAVKICEEFIGEDDFLMYLGDNLINTDLNIFVEEFKEKNHDAFILLTPVEDPTRFGIAVMKDSKVVNVVEKPKTPPSNLAIIGVYIFKPSVFQAIDNIKPSWRGELEITDAIQWLIQNEKNVGAHVIYGWWKDTGKPEDLIEANRTVLENISNKIIDGNVYENSVVQGNVIIEKGAKIIDSIVRGPVIIGQNATVNNAYIGPYTSIGNNVNIEDSEVENSIILDGAIISSLGVRMDSSIIGANSHIVSVKKKPKTVKLVIGDYGKIELPE